MRKDKTIFKYDELINQVLDQSIAFTKSRVLLTAYELDIFTILGDSPKTADDVAQIVNGDRNGITRLMNALVALELLEKNGAKYRNNKAAYSLLVKGNPNYMANLKYMTYIWKNWDNLTESVMTGTARNSKYVSEFEHEELVDYIAAENWRANLQAPEVIKLSKLENVERVLDLGCASGAFGMEVLKQMPNVNLTLFDFPNVIEITNEYVEKKGLSERVQTIGGDMFDDDFGTGYDVVILSNVVRSYSLMDSMIILRRVFDSLVKGGKVIIHEFLLEEARDKPEFSALLSLNMLVSSNRGDVLTETDTWLILKESMFSDIKRDETSFGSFVIIGQK
jgi:predicted O-methyltransferase YrrM